MKCLAVFACLFVVSYAAITPDYIEKIKEKMHKLGGECKTEIGASEDDIAPLLKHEPPTTEKGKCFVACMGKKMGFQDQSGKIDKDGTYKVAEKVKAIDEDVYGKLKNVADICLAEVTDTDNECETAVNLLTCFKREKAAVGLESLNF